MARGRISESSDFLLIDILMCSAAVPGPGSAAEIKDGMKILVFIDISENRCISILCLRTS